MAVQCRDRTATVRERTGGRGCYRSVRDSRMLLAAGPNYLGDLIAVVIVLLVQGACARSMGRDLHVQPMVGRTILPLFCGSAILIVFGFLLRFARVSRYFPRWFTGWGRGAILTWALLSLLLAIAWA